ncbi:MAG TPA: type II toxin-antitoxin system CcdA family antitoxin [Alphaproteobacteria bacterium]|nr:type II toxin-antitoxin system CcdA family antitoxin [Alphaproteobacteria bacterium]
MIRARAAFYDRTAGKKTVSLTINSDLTRRVKQAGINASQIAEEALAAELERIGREEMAKAAQAEIEAYNAYIDRHGLFADAVRAHQESESSNGEAV